MISDAPVVRRLARAVDGADDGDVVEVYAADIRMVIDVARAAKRARVGRWTFGADSNLAGAVWPERELDVVLAAMESPDGRDDG